MNPILTLALETLPLWALLGALAAWRRTFPNGPLLALAALPLVLCVARVFAPSAWWGWLAWPAWILDGQVALLAIVDVVLLPDPRRLGLERQLGRIASLSKDHPVTLLLANPTRRAMRLALRDGVPAELEPRPEQFELVLGARSRATLRYVLRGARRGAFQWSGVYVRVRSPLALWWRHARLTAPAVVHVYPDLKQLGEYAVLARADRLNLMGVRRTRKIGQDHDFERLRDYTPDDNYKHIDWRTTARRRKLTVRDYQASQSQRLVFLVDCGRMMTNEAAGLSLLDHALNAMLMLSYVALSKGDSVGLLCFSNEVHSYVPPKGGRGQMNRLLHACFDRFPRLVESRYDEAFLYFSGHCRKRTLVILITNLIDEVNARQVSDYLTTTARRHLALGVMLRDRRLFEAADRPRPSGSELFRAAAAAEILTWRQQLLADLGSRGVLSLDVFPEDMTAPLVNRYLEIKARHLL